MRTAGTRPLADAGSGAGCTARGSTGLIASGGGAVGTPSGGRSGATPGERLGLDTAGGGALGDGMSAIASNSPSLLHVLALQTSSVNNTPPTILHRDRVMPQGAASRVPAHHHPFTAHARRTAIAAPPELGIESRDR
jgi:hypothetical protein